MKYTLLLCSLFLSILSCKGQAQTPSQQMKTNNTTSAAATNPLLCDVETGICEVPAAAGAAPQASTTAGKQKPVKVIYYTDPICSSCWGIEPQLRKLKLEYGDALEIEYRMGGLLPDWSYNSGGISKPSDVAHHWDEVSLHYDMPIDGDVWLEDPLPSSYPPSIAFKAAQMQDKDKAVVFMRALRELLFLQKKNITKWEFMAAAAQKADLDVAKLQQDYEGKAKDLFAEDLELGRKLGVRGFPTIFFVNNAGTQETVYGSKPFSAYEQAIKKLHPTAEKHAYATDWKSLFSKYPSLTSREFSELSAMPRNHVEAYLETLHKEGHLWKTTTKNGTMWHRAGMGR